VLYNYQQELISNVDFVTGLAEHYEHEYKLDAALAVVHYESEVYKHILRRVDNDPELLKSPLNRRIYTWMALFKLRVTQDLALRRALLKKSEEHFQHDPNEEPERTLEVVRYWELQPRVVREQRNLSEVVERVVRETDDKGELAGYLALMLERDPEHGVSWKPSVTAALRKGQRLVERGG